MTFAVTVNNGGNGTANYVNNYGTTCGGTVTVCGPALTGAGVLIADKIPTNASGTPLPVVSMSPSPGPQALPTGTTITMVYTTDTTAVTGWTVKPAATFPPTAAYVGIFMTGSPTNYALGADPTPAAAPTTGPGSVSALRLANRLVAAAGTSARKSFGQQHRHGSGRRQQGLHRGPGTHNHEHGLRSERSERTGRQSGDSALNGPAVTERTGPRSLKYSPSVHAVAL